MRRRSKSRSGKGRTLALVALVVVVLGALVAGVRWYVLRLAAEAGAEAGAAVVTGQREGLSAWFWDTWDWATGGTSADQAA